MTQKAIDIVLLPDEGIQKICREVNQNIGGKIDFIGTWKTPHISLLMGIMNDEQLSEIQEKLLNIVQKYSEIVLTWRLRKYTIWNTWETGYSYELDENEDVKNLFSDIIREIRHLLHYEGISTDMFYTPEEVEEQSCIWVKGFEDRTVEEYSSHITLGIWELQGDNPDMIQFTTNTLAVYQLWNYCTCDNKLFELKLWE